MWYCGQGRLSVANSVSPVGATLPLTQVKTGLVPGSKPKWEQSSGKNLVFIKIVTSLLCHHPLIRLKKRLLVCTLITECGWKSPTPTLGTP